MRNQQRKNHKTKRNQKSQRRVQMEKPNQRGTMKAEVEKKLPLRANPIWNWKVKGNQSY